MSMALLYLLQYLQSWRNCVLCWLPTQLQRKLWSVNQNVTCLQSLMVAAAPWSG